MPEGDSVAGHAERLRPALVGEEIDRVAGTAASVRANSARILAATVEQIRTVGKNLVIDLSTGYSIRVHLGMTGRWRVTDLAAGAHGSARLVLTTRDRHVACFGAPTVQVGRTPAIDADLGTLGPDVLADFDAVDYLRRARTVADTSVAALLLDQRVLAGIGNVYKSELLFLEGLHPETPVSEIGDEQLRSIADRARKLMAVNVGRGPRVTTGSGGRGRELWVYGRSGRPCRRCGAAIEQKRHPDRATYWCPRCQPPQPEGP